MPFAVCLGDGAPELTQIFAGGAEIDPHCAVLIGARSLDRRERELVKKSGIHVFTMREIDERHVGALVSEAIEIASSGTSALHVSFDMDCLDPSIAPGVGTPVAGGLSYREAHLAMELLADCGRVHSQPDRRAGGGTGRIGTGQAHSLEHPVEQQQRKDVESESQRRRAEARVQRQ
jgi:arginase